MCETEKVDLRFKLTPLPCYNKHMDYTLCKKLKDAEFPQGYENRRGRTYWMRDFSDGDETLIVHGNHEIDGDNALDDNQLTLVPTLSELIKECGVRFKSLTFYPITQDAKWIALGVEDEIGGSINTPEIAVANLFLALQEGDKIESSTLKTE